MKPNVAKILNQMVEGNWKSALPLKMFQALDTWFQRHTEDVVVRIVFWDSDRKCKFACHFLCDPGGFTRKIFIPGKEYWEDPNSFLLGIPDELRDKPLYCLPHDTIKKALKKRKDKDARKDGEKT